MSRQVGRKHVAIAARLSETHGMHHQVYRLDQQREPTPAEAHGGELTLRDSDELPTLFVFRLPIQRRTRRRTPTQAPAVEAPSDDKKH